MSAIKAEIHTNKVPMFKLTIKEHFESDWPSSKSNFTSLEPTKIRTLFGTPGINQRKVKYEQTQLSTYW